MASLGSLRQLCIARGCFAGAHETREVIDVGEAVGASLVIGLAGGGAKVGDFVRLEAAGDAHFVEVGVGGKGQEAGLVGLPTEAAASGLAGGFHDGKE